MIRDRPIRSSSDRRYTGAARPRRCGAAGAEEPLNRRTVAPAPGPARPVPVTEPPVAEHTARAGRARGPARRPGTPSDQTGPRGCRTGVARYYCDPARRQYPGRRHRAGGTGRVPPARCGRGQCPGQRLTVTVTRPPGQPDSEPRGPAAGLRPRPGHRGRTVLRLG
eukprot:653841-Hanusia_phi.AAC.1